MVALEEPGTRLGQFTKVLKLGNLVDEAVRSDEWARLANLFRCRYWHSPPRINLNGCNERRISRNPVSAGSGQLHRLHRQSHLTPQAALTAQVGGLAPM